MSSLRIIILDLFSFFVSDRIGVETNRAMPNESIAFFPDLHIPHTTFADRTHLHLLSIQYLLCAPIQPTHQPTQTFPPHRYSTPLYISSYYTSPTVNANPRRSRSHPSNLLPQVSSTRFLPLLLSAYLMLLRSRRGESSSRSSIIAFDSSSSSTPKPKS